MKFLMHVEVAGALTSNFECKLQYPGYLSLINVGNEPCSLASLTYISKCVLGNLNALLFLLPQGLFLSNSFNK